MKFDIRLFFENLARKVKFRYILTRTAGTLHENLCKYMIISRRILLTTRNIPDKVVEKVKTHNLCTITLFSENCFVYEIMW
jgi:hypothetical protein